MTDLGVYRLPPADRVRHQPVPGPDGPTAPDLVLMLKRQLWPLVIAGAAGLLAGGLHHATSPERYYAAAVVLVDERAADPGQEFAAGFPALRSETAVLNEMQVLRSLELAKTVTRELGLHDHPAFLHPPASLARQTLSDLKSAASAFLPTEEAAGPATQDEEAPVLAAAVKLQSEVGIHRVGRSFSIEISMIHHDPALAADIANAYAEAYLAQSRLASREAANAGAAWLRENIAEVRESADAAAREAAEFRAVNRALDPQGMQALDQRVATLNEIHARLLERLEMITIEGSYPIANGRLLGEALVPRDPALPKAWRVLSGGLVLGLLAGLLVAAWRELRETGLRTGEDVRAATGLPFLGYLPRFRKARLRRLRPVLMKPLLLEGAPAVAFSRFRARPSDDVRRVDHADPIRHFAPHLYLPSVAPDHPYNDPLKGLLARVTRTATDAGCLAAVASLHGREGRTTLAANLAQFAALGGLKTLLVDADLTNPALSRDLGFTSEPGLAEVLAGRATIDECATELPATGLKVLPYVIPAAPVGQASTLKLAGHLAAARASFDLIVLDTQPLGASSDVAALLGTLDTVVMVADWGRTGRAALQSAMSNDPDLARKTVGVVLNRTIMHRLGAYGAGLDRSARRGHRVRA